MKYLKFLSIWVLLFIYSSINTCAQSRHFFHRIDFGSGNLYTFVGSNLITAFANYFSHDVLFDNSFNYTFFNGENSYGSIKTKPNNLLGLSAKDLFNDLSSGIKLGYKSDNFGNFNWGLYGTCQYKLNQFRSNWTLTGEFNHERFSYLKPGVSIYTLFGSIENKIKWQLEAGVQYCMPLTYSGSFGKGSGILNKGIASHYAVKIGGATDFSCGIFLDMYHFDIFKKEYVNNFKMYNIGVTFTITPKRSERYYD